MEWSISSPYAISNKLAYVQNQLVNQLVSEFKICGLIKQKLDEVAYSDKQIKQLVESVMEGVVKLESSQNGADTKQIKEAFQETAKGKQGDKMFYYGILVIIKHKIEKILKLVKGISHGSTISQPTSKSKRKLK